MHMTSNAPARKPIPAPARFPDESRSEIHLHPREYDFFLRISSHHAQKRPVIQLDQQLCELARAHAERELARHTPESILLYLCHSDLRDERFPGIVRSQTLLPKSEDSSKNAMNAILGNTADGRHLLAWNRFFQTQSHIGVGYAAPPRSEARCYVFLSAEPRTSS